MSHQQASELVSDWCGLPGDLSKAGRKLGLINAQNCHQLNIEGKVEQFESVIPRVLYLCGLKH